MYRKITDEMTNFIKKSPTAFHAVENIAEQLRKEGFVELKESEMWNVIPGGKYYVTRNQTSVIALKLGRDLEEYNFQIAASHSDSPTFKIKENGELTVKDQYLQLNTEGYGGMLCAPWFDRPLSIAGRVVVKEKEKLVSRLLCVDRDLVMIPNVAIHMNREINSGYKYNKQVDMLPLFGGADCKEGELKKLVAQELSVNEDDIYSMDLYLYNRMAPSVWGAKEEFVSCAQLDDLQCAYTSLQGFLKGSNDNNINVFACFDNEEVGSGTKQGADSTFLQDVLSRINLALGKSGEDYLRAIACSFLVSCDNAHALHPNHPEKSDATNSVYMNQGIVIKSNADQKYTSDGVSISVFKRICEKAEVPVQSFANRSDERGGSTLGNIAMAHTSMNAVDIGLPQLAMHSCYETAGVRDSYYMERAITEFYNSHIDVQEGVICI